MVLPAGSQALSVSAPQQVQMTLVQLRILFSLLSRWAGGEHSLPQILQVQVLGQAD